MVTVERFAYHLRVCYHIFVEFNVSQAYIACNISECTSYTSDACDSVWGLCYIFSVQSSLHAPQCQCRASDEIIINEGNHQMVCVCVGFGLTYCLNGLHQTRINIDISSQRPKAQAKLCWLNDAIYLTHDHLRWLYSSQQICGKKNRTHAASKTAKW